MKKNKVLSLAVAAVMACGANMAYGQNLIHYIIVGVIRIKN